MTARIVRGLLLLGLASCSGPNARQRGDTIVTFVGSPKSTQIWVDGRFVAPLQYARGGIALSPGVHQIQLSADGYFPRYLDIEIQAHSKREIRFELIPELP